MTEMLQQIFDLCVVPLLGVVTTYIVKLINKKNKEIDTKLTSEVALKYNDIVSNIIKECVISTNQTYVDALKGQNLFDSDAQKEAFKKTYDKVMSILTDAIKEQLSNVYGDLTIYITTKIEAEVNQNKTEKKPEVKLEIKAEEKKTDDCKEENANEQSKEKVDENKA